jgi:hypothetical protein
MPGARWWIWGSLVTSRIEPLFGDLATLNAAVIVPAADFAATPQRLLLVASVRSAEELHRVEADIVVELAPEDPDREATDIQLKRWRSHGSRNIIDDRTRNQIPAGFIEVLP